jgi:hypothetical protein
MISLILYDSFLLFFHILLQKSKRGRCKCSQSSSACKSHEKKSNTKLDVIRTDPPEMPLRIVKADGQKDYIHLRARRGQATNSHSLAERVNICISH